MAGKPYNRLCQRPSHRLDITGLSPLETGNTE